MVADSRGTEWFSGGFAWTGFDYRGEPTPYRWPDINSHFASWICVVSQDRYYYYQSWWTDKDVLISPLIGTGRQEGQPIPVWVNTNADNVELLLTGKAWKEGICPATVTGMDRKLCAR